MMSYTFILIIVNMYWGLTQILMKHSLNYMGFSVYVMMRYLSAASIYILIFNKRILKLRRRTLCRGALLGSLLFLQTLSNTFALYYTSASNAVFISQLSIVLVPTYYLIVYREKPKRHFVISALCVLSGLIVFSRFFVNGLNVGDGISCISMLLLCAQILIGDVFLKEEASFDLAIVQILVAAVLSTLVGVGDIQSIVWNAYSIMIIILTGVIGTGLANTLRMLAQKRINPSYLMLISVLHPLFTLVGSACIPNHRGVVESVSMYQLAGSIVIVSGLIYFFIEDRKSHQLKL